MGIGGLARSLLDRAGYVLWKREFLRYGIDPLLDVARLSKAWDRTVDTVFDVGANDGGFVRGALPQLPQARFLSFEPHPRTFDRLRNRVSDPRVTLWQSGLGEEIGEVDFYEYGTEGDGSLMNSMVPDAQFAVRRGYEAKRITVPCTTVDAFCAQEGVSRIDLLKLDVEGYEAAVLRGSRGMLSSGRIGFVYAEFNDLKPHPKATGGSILELADELEPFGFRYIATYTDFVVPEGDLHVCANVLFGRPPR